MQASDLADWLAALIRGARDGKVRVNRDALATGMDPEEVVAVRQRGDDLAVSLDDGRVLFVRVQEGTPAAKTYAENDM